jgi:hypothetical protein
MVVDQWVITVSQQPPGVDSQNAGTYWVQSVGDDPPAQLLADIAYRLDLELYNTFGAIQADRRWFIGRSANKLII